MFPEHYILHALHDKQAEIGALARQEALAREAAEARPAAHALRIALAVFLKLPRALLVALGHPADHRLAAPACVCPE